MEKIWKYIPNSNGYFVSNFGEVRNSHISSWNDLCECFNSRCSQVLKPTYSFGYQYVGIHYLDGSCKRERVHRLVAKAFVKNPNDYKVVNHKNGHKDDNRAMNLEWCNNSQNVRYAYRTGLINIENFRSIKSSQATPYVLMTEDKRRLLFGTQKELLNYLGVGKTKFRSLQYQKYLHNLGVVCRKITKEVFFALEGSTTIPSGGAIPQQE